MAEKPEKVENFRLWWAVWLIAATVMGFLFGVHEDAVGGYPIWFVLYAADGALLLFALGKMPMRTSVWIFFPATIGLVIIGVLVGGWLTHLVK